MHKQKRKHKTLRSKYLNVLRSFSWIHTTLVIIYIQKKCIMHQYWSLWQLNLFHAACQPGLSLLT